MMAYNSYIHGHNMFMLNTHISKKCDITIFNNLEQRQDRILALKAKYLVVSRIASHTQRIPGSVNMFRSRIKAPKELTLKLGDYPRLFRWT
jgi:hypothetical protein